MKHVLIIDDEQSLLFSMKAGFEPFKNELRIHTASNGREAIKILESHHMDLVVTDLKMPEMDGFEVLTHLNENYPGLPAMVMTAFNTPDIEARLTAERSLTIFEKPVNFDEFSKAIIEAVNTEAGEGSVSISLSSFMQLIQSEQKTCLLEVKSKDRIGHIYFENGELLNAISGGFRSEDAVYDMLTYKDPQMSFKRLPLKRIKKVIKSNLMQILMEGMRRIDEKEDNGIPDPEDDIQETVNDTTSDSPLPEESPEGDQTIPQNPQPEGVNNMAGIKETLEKFKTIEGFMAAGAFSPNGEMAAEVNVAGVNIAELGALANDVLLKAQKATEIMGVGRGQLVHIEAPKAHVFARCLNEATDFAATATGRAHVHLVMVIDKEGNVAMSKMKLSSIISEVAEHFR